MGSVRGGGSALGEELEGPEHGRRALADAWVHSRADGHTARESSRKAVLFFFSSRRRHTRFKCDWSSDVCSSDLLAAAQQHLCEACKIADRGHQAAATGFPSRHVKRIALDMTVARQRFCKSRALGRDRKSVV